MKMRFEKWRKIWKTFAFLMSWLETVFTRIWMIYENQTAFTSSMGNEWFSVTLFETFWQFIDFSALVFRFHMAQYQRHGTELQIGKINNTIFSVINPARRLFLLQRPWREFWIDWFIQQTDNDMRNKGLSKHRFIYIIFLSFSRSHTHAIGKNKQIFSDSQRDILTSHPRRAFVRCFCFIIARYDILRNSFRFAIRY